MQSFVRAKIQMAAIIAGSMLAGSLMTGTAFAYQSHMWNAMHSLQNARQQLVLASPNKAGYRDQAIGLVDQAMAAVNAGIHAGAY